MSNPKVMSVFFTPPFEKGGQGGFKGFAEGIGAGAWRGLNCPLASLSPPNPPFSKGGK